MANQAPSTTTTSIRNVPLRTVPNVVVDVEEELKIRKKLARLGYAPEPWCARRRADDREVVALLMASPIEMTMPDALDMIGWHGRAACEAVAIWTLAHMRGAVGRKKVESPRGLLIWALKKPERYWTSAAVDIFIEEEWRQVTQHAKHVARDEDNAELLALFGEEIPELPAAWEIDAARAPENVTRITAVR